MYINLRTWSIKFMKLSFCNPILTLSYPILHSICEHNIILDATSTFKGWAHNLHCFQASLLITLFDAVLQLDMNESLYIYFSKTKS